MREPRRKPVPGPDRTDRDDRTDQIGRRDLTSWPSRAGQAAVRMTLRAIDWSRGWLDDKSIPVVVLLVTAVIGVLVAGVFTVLSAQIYDNVADQDGVAGFDRPVLDWWSDGERRPSTGWSPTTRTSAGRPRCRWSPRSPL